ncbi:MAG: hypothetical protein RJB56_540, partial [Actinomycetota bacterium]
MSRFVVAALAFALSWAGTTGGLTTPALAAVSCPTNWTVSGIQCQRTFTPATAGVFTVPAGVTRINATIIGGGGGTGGGDGAFIGGSASKAGDVQGFFTVSEGDQLGIYPGFKGANGGSAINSAWGGAGGADTYPHSDADYRGGTGGIVGTYGTSGGGGGGGAASIITLGTSSTSLKFGAGGAGGGGGASNTRTGGTGVDTAGSSLNTYGQNGASVQTGYDGGSGGGGGGGFNGAAGGSVTLYGSEYVGEGGTRGTSRQSNGSFTNTLNSMRSNTGDGWILLYFDGTEAPVISGTPSLLPSAGVKVGNTITASATYTGTPTPTKYYQFQAYNSSTSSWEDIGSATTSNTFVTTLAQVGKQVRVGIYATNTAGTSVTTYPTQTPTIGLATPTAPDLQTGSDLGTSNTDNITNDNTPTFDLAGYVTGTDVIVTATKSGTTVTCEVLLTTSGNQNCTFAALADGTWAITAIQRKDSTSSSASSAFNLTIDTAGPQVTAITFVPTLTKNHTVNVEVTFNEPILSTAGTLSQDAIELTGISSGWTVSTLTRDAGNTSKAVFTLSQSGNLAFEGDLTLRATAGLAQDQFGQQSLASAMQATGNFDETRPWAAWSGTPTADTIKGKTADKLPLTLTFSEPIRGLANSDFSFTGAGATGCAAEISATSIAQNATSPYAVTVNITSCTASGLVNVTLNADSVHDYTDTTGNLGPATALTTSFTRDITAPTITAISKTVDGTDVNYEVTFSEPVTGFTAADITVAHTLAGEAANWTIGTVTLKAGTDSTYLFTVSNSNAKTGTLSISISGAGVTDLPGNTLTATMPTTSGGNDSNATLYYLPRFTINTLTMIGPDAVALASNFVLDGRGGSITGFRINLTNAQSGDNFGFTATSGFASSSSSTSNNGVATASITISASNKTEAEWQAAIRNITVRNTAGSSASTATRNFEFVVTPNNTYAGDSVADGLTQTATTTVDLTGPALSSFTTTAPTGRSNLAGFTVNFTFSEAFRNFANTDVLLTGTGTTGCTVGTPTAASDGTAPYESAVTIIGCSGNGTIIATLAANSINDMVGPTGNAGPVATQLASFTRDGIAPTLSSVAKTTGELSVTYEYAFSESIDGLDIDALTISHTGIGGTTGWSMSTPTIKSGTTSTYVFTLSRTTEVSGDLSITLKTADVTDLAGNTLTGTGAIVDGNGDNSSLVTFYYLPTFNIGSLNAGGKSPSVLAPNFTLDAKGGTVAG